jgi:hypothetical protein
LAAAFTQNPHAALAKASIRAKVEHPFDVLKRQSLRCATDYWQKTRRRSSRFSRSRTCGWRDGSRWLP